MEGKAVGGYTPPTSTYALSAADAIPPDYVAHARDACVEVDTNVIACDYPKTGAMGVALERSGVPCTGASDGICTV